MTYLSFSGFEGAQLLRHRLCQPVLVRGSRRRRSFLVSSSYIFGATTLSVTILGLLTLTTKVKSGVVYKINVQLNAILQRRGAF